MTELTKERIEEVLKESEARFRSIFDNASAGMALVDRDGYVIMANEADCRFLGYPAEELIGLHFSRFTHPDDLDLDAGLYESLVKGERASYLIDKRYLRKDGEVVWGRLSVSLIRNESGQVHYTVIVCEDITEHRQAEQALRESEERYHSIFANSHAVMLLIDPETTDIVDANPAAAALSMVIHLKGCEP